MGRFGAVTSTLTPSRWINRYAIPWIVALLCLLTGGVAPVQAEEEGWLIASRRVGGQADLWAIPASGGAWRQLTDSPGDERWPAWHPEYHTVAYAARRERNWDIYLLDLRTGEEERLTSGPQFDGWPAWSPDGARLAFASMRDGNLDIFLLDPESGESTNVTEESAGHEFEPRWEGERRLLYVSTRDRSHDLYRLDLDAGREEAVTETREVDERAPQVVPGSGDLLVRTVSIASRAQEILRLSAGGGPEEIPFSWTGAVLSMALSPAGDSVAWLERRVAGDMLYRRSLEGGETERLNGPTAHLDDLAWGLPDERWMDDRLHPPRVEEEARTVTGPGGLVEVPDLDAPQPTLYRGAVAPFQALRARLIGELGSDFLGEVSETTRPVSYSTSMSDYLSWHKAGRAVDTLLYLPFRSGFRWMDIVREDRHGDVYWRIILRCAEQDGSCGEPLVETPWDYSPAAQELAPEQGGVRSLFQSGYYVDFTRLAEDEGWERIGSYEYPDFDWRSEMTAMEYWHYQFTRGVDWYSAMKEIYDDETLEEHFGWEQLEEQGLARWVLRAKGVPLPPHVRQAPAEMVVP